jgi:hypothetical protein
MNLLCFHGPDPRTRPQSLDEGQIRGQKTGSGVIGGVVSDVCCSLVLTLIIDLVAFDGPIVGRPWFKSSKSSLDTLCDLVLAMDAILNHPVESLHT